MDIILTDEILDWLGELFFKNRIHANYGISFEIFVNEWKLGRIEKYI